MNEEEVREIVKNFNESLNKHMTEQVDLERKIQSLIDKVEDKQLIVSRLLREKDELLKQITDIALNIEMSYTAKEQML